MTTQQRGVAQRPRRAVPVVRRARNERLCRAARNTEPRTPARRCYSGLSPAALIPRAPARPHWRYPNRYFPPCHGTRPRHRVGRGVGRDGHAEARCAPLDRRQGHPPGVRKGRCRRRLPARRAGQRLRARPDDPAAGRDLFDPGHDCGRGRRGAPSARRGGRR